MEHNTKDNTKLFRQSSLEKISSPEDLNDYVRVANPGVWMILIAVIILLVGFCVWGFTAELQTVVKGVMITDAGVSVCYISEDDADKVEPGMVIRSNNKEYTISDTSGSSIDAMDVLTDYAMHVGGFSRGEWLRPLFIEGDNSENPAGTFAAEITVENVKPISFILN